MAKPNDAKDAEPRELVLKLNAETYLLYGVGAAVREAFMDAFLDELVGEQDVNAPTTNT